MAVLKWLAIAMVSLIGGYFGHKLTGNWSGAAIATAGAAMVLGLLANGQWIPALVALGLGVYLFFNALGDGPDHAQTRGAPAPAASVGASPEGPGAPQPMQGDTDSLQQTLKNKLAELLPRESAGQKTPASDTEMGNGKVLQDCSDCPQLVIIPAGQFAMGSGVTAPVDERELPQHPVTVRSFAAGRYAVTRGEFAAFVKASHYQTDAERDGGCFAWMKDNWENNRHFNWRQAGFHQNDDHPVVCVSWNDAQAYVKWLSETSHHSYRLLSEAEREYTARAGSTTAFWWGDSLTTEQANYDGRSAGHTGREKDLWRQATVPVNHFAANAFGMYNVHGNVWEWVQDCQHANYSGAPADGSAWTSACSDTRRVLRGGGWMGNPTGLQSASRGWFAPDFRFHVGGFRVARSVGQQK